ncbi:hypothetical protein LSAT2_031400, partial [Lamellibrachia satsuma]
PLSDVVLQEGREQRSLATKGLVKEWSRSPVIGSEDIGTGFAQVTGWAFKDVVHPVIAAWFGKHFDEQGWTPTHLLSYLTESSPLTHLHTREVITSFEAQKEIWLPEDRDQGCIIIGKFTKGAKAEGKRLTCC